MFLYSEYIELSACLSTFLDTEKQILIGNSVFLKSLSSKYNTAFF